MNNPASQRMTKSQVCKYLGKSKRSIESYVAKGLLSVEHMAGPNGTVAVFDRAAVRKFKTDWANRFSYESLAEKGAIVPAGPIALAPRPAKPLALPAPAAAPGPDNSGFEALAAHLAKLSALYPDPTLAVYVPLDEAARLSGLPKTFLLQQAKAGIAWAINAATTGKRPVWRFRVTRQGIIERS